MCDSPNAPLDFERLYQEFVTSLLASDRRACRASFEQWLDSNTGLRSLYEDLVQRALYQVGDLWERGRISVATEHLATAIAESLLNLTYPLLFGQRRCGKSAIVACVANEYHQIGGKMVADLFELNGWRGYFLGANTPVAALSGLIVEKRPDVVALSVSVSFSLSALVDAATEIRARFPDTPILVGGQAFRWGGRQRVESISGVRCLSTLSELEAWMRDVDTHV